MNKLYIEFTDGEYFFGTFYLYKSNNYLDRYSYNYRIDSITTTSYIKDCDWIKPENSDFFYTVSSILKIGSISESKYKSIIRDKKLNSILLK